MKLQDLFEEQNEAKIARIKSWLRVHGIDTDYVTINPDLSVDIHENIDVNISNFRPGLKRIPIKFGHIEGTFDVSDNALLSLKNSPRIVDAYFYCQGNKIKNFIGGPERVGIDFHADVNPIQSFEGAPKFVGENVNIETETLSSLHDIHKHFKYIGGIILIPRRTISHMLGLMFIKGLKGIEKITTTGTQLPTAVEIMNKYLPGGNVHDAQQELIEVGLSNFAKL